MEKLQDEKTCFLAVLVGLLLSNVTVMASELPEKTVELQEVAAEAPEKTVELQEEVVESQEVKLANTESEIAVAAETTVVDSGIWKGVSWTLYSDGYLYLETVAGTSGNGEGTPDWVYYYKDQIKSVKMVTTSGSTITSTSNWFTDCVNLVSVDGSEWNTGKITAMEQMFKGCSSLREISCTNWDMRKVTSVWNMFGECSALTELNLSSWDFDCVENIMAMFSNCSALAELNLSGWDLDNVVNLSGLFMGCTNLRTLDTSGWSINQTVGLEATFADCRSLTSVDLTMLGGIGYFSETFSNCTSLQTINSPEDKMIKTGDAYKTFYNCKNLTSLPELSFDISDNATSMFEGCEKLSATIRFHSLPGDYTDLLKGVATDSSATVYVTFFGIVKSDAMKIVDTKSSNSRVYLKQIAPTSYRFDKEEKIYMQVGETIELTHLVAPTNATVAFGINTILRAAVDGSDAEPIVISTAEARRNG